MSYQHSGSVDVPANSGEAEQAYSVKDSASLKADSPIAVCTVCPHHCKLREGQTGRCRARACVQGTVQGISYAKLTSIALDPIEKKPIACWNPGTKVLSVGSFGCTMSCPFCQNSEIAAAGESDVPWREVSPIELVDIACSLRKDNPKVIGIAYTYNEPLTFWEYIRDCSTLAHERGLKNVLVSNGMVMPETIQNLSGLIDAANIDYKAFDEDTYRSLGGDISCVRSTIEALAADPTCHLEVTTLVVPGISDSEEGVDGAARWLASLSPDIVYHITRFFPHYRMSNAAPTPVSEVYHLADVARHHLKNVFVGNC